MEKTQATGLLTTKPLNLDFKELLQLEERLSQDKELEELYQSLQGYKNLNQYERRVQMETASKAGKTTSCGDEPKN